MQAHILEIGDAEITLEQLTSTHAHIQTIQLSDAAVSKINFCREYLDNKIENSEESFYGINTGFGYLYNVKIPDSQLEELQANLLKSHACGMGEEVPAEIVKLMLLFKVKSLSFGYSGVQLQTVERLAKMYNNDVLPVVYTQGSLGASGDLAPLSHLCLPIIGMGEVTMHGNKMQAKYAKDYLGWEPIQLKSKEGLALINGTQFMSAYGIHCLAKSKKLLQWANVIAAISIDGFDCTPDFLDERIQRIRPHKGQIETAKIIRELLKGSGIISRKKEHVQDPYSFRCIPQVHGATMDTVSYVLSVFEKEINSVTDNPNIFPDDDAILSGGNFHGQPLALTLDFLSIAMAEIGSISERRTYQLINGLRELPPSLTKHSGLHSGFMIPQYTAAGIVSENKQLCTPACVDTVPSSNNQEDHVSMGANAATKCKRVIDNVEKVLAIELLTACQALDFRRPLKSSPYLENVFEAFRKNVGFLEEDRILHEDMMQAVKFMNEHELKNL